MILWIGVFCGTSFRDMNSVGEVVCDDPHICHPRERASSRWLDTSPAWYAAGLPSSPVTFHSGGGHAGDMHWTIVPQGPSSRVPISQYPRGYPFAAVRRRHDILHPRVMGGGAYSLHHDGYILGFFRPSLESGEVGIYRFWAFSRGGGGLLSDTGDTGLRVTYSVPRFASCGSSTPQSRLAASDSEGGVKIGRLEGTHIISGWSARPAQGRAVSHSQFLQDAGGHPTAGDSHARLLLAWPQARSGSRRGAGGVVDRLPARFPRQFGRALASTHQRGASNQVGVETDAAAGGPHLEDFTGRKR